ncbi:Vacuolar sorting protein 9 (VPS9) domain containing protein [Acanthamoeba castellanii str. Neff]|uniref:Vacuolar sorting protein 9 (VPS9) domain containing protein n=1 Tax=Acanthamoeba castellanii (strain ATCC 30010 / Neff) TaxID=1257118 RepID=L8GTV1_ACACF|nr:Vacuolar sorting protein 9 (VPS9) domain containing protein [Acanthamoeba castellanii str. Neff]ELR16367.1 Vacuolar sorting protein 9 (VPS9) domain containing protein [Acanthamoeba castellanii str. Neff]
MEAEDALKDLLQEIALQETAITAVTEDQARTHRQDRQGKEQSDHGIVAGDDEVDANDDDVKDEDGGLDDESFKRSEFGSRKVTMAAGVRLSLALQKDWWRSLPDLAYVVTKINQYGKRQTRTLRLTSEGIENVRKNGKVSSLYPYEAVVRVYMKNVRSFVIDYKNAKHSYQYRSTVAMHIVQEITSRLALRRQEDRLLTPDIATRLQEKLQQTGLLEPPITTPPRSTRQQQAQMGTYDDRRSRQAKKLHSILGTTEQQRLENAIDSMILDVHTPEGRTLKQFCSNFAVLEKNPATLVMNVRQFMDDMRAYIIERHAGELAKLTVEAAAQSLAHEELSLSSVIENSLERALVSRFRDRIVACLKKPTKEEEMHLKRKVAAASTKPQSFFGISEEHVSSSGWTHAIAELQALDDWDVPGKLLAAVLAAAKSVYATLNYERNRGKKGEHRTAIFLSADDFFPIFLYVVARANLKDPLLVSEYLWGLCDPEQLNGEGGYYLTVFCSAFEYLKGLEMDTAESECQQREEEALKYLDDKVLQPSDHSPKEINSSTSVDSYFAAATATAANKTSLLQLAEDKRQRTISAPNKGGKSKQLIRQRAEERDSRVVIGLAGCRTAQETVDEREKEKQRLKALAGLQESVPPWPTAAVRQRTATLRAEHNAAVVAAAASSGDEGEDDSSDEDEDDDREDGRVDGGDGGGGGPNNDEDGAMGGSQRARRRASKLDRRQVRQAIARYDVAQKED